MEEEEEGGAITSFGILPLRCARPSHSLCTVVSELIALKQLVIERGEVQRRSEKAIKRTPGSGEDSYVALLKLLQGREKAQQDANLSSVGRHAPATTVSWCEQYLL